MTREAKGYSKLKMRAECGKEMLIKDDSYRDHLVEELIDGIFYSLKIKDDKKGMTFNEYQKMVRRTSDREREVQWRLLMQAWDYTRKRG